MYQIRDNFNIVFNAAGQHEVKVGAEYMYQMHHLFWDQLEHGTIDAQGGADSRQHRGSVPRLE